MSNNNEDEKGRHHSDEASTEPRTSQAPSAEFLKMDPQTRELAAQVFQSIENYELNTLKNVFSENPHADVTTLYNIKGRTVLHSAAIKNDDSILDYLLSLASSVSEDRKKRWVNQPTPKEGLTALHFTAWNGNIDSLNTLVRHGADMNIVSPTGIGLMHIAAQADQSAFLVYLRQRGLSPLTTDKWQATPLHWACYSAAENSVNYLLAWTRNFNRKDCEGLTPLHLAVWSALTSGNLRPLKLLLLHGANRQARSKEGLRPIDYVARTNKVHPATTKKEVYQAIEEPRKLRGCFQMKMPLRKHSPSLVNILNFFLLFYFGNAAITLIFLPLVNSVAAATIYWILMLIVATFFLIAWLRDPGYVYKRPNPDFPELAQKLDPAGLCPECESVKSLRSRHCNICGKCVERYDHHCPWINNCVGTRNHGPFYCFVLTIFIDLFYGLVVIMVGYFAARERGFVGPLPKGNFPPGLVANFLLRHAPAIHIAFVIMLLYISFFLFLVGILLSVQTKNLLLGRTTYERFSNMAAQDYGESHGEIINEFVDTISLWNCVFMCWNCEVPQQQKLRDFLTRTRLKSSASILSSTSFSGLSTHSYHRALLQETSADIQEVKSESIEA